MIKQEEWAAEVKDQLAPRIIKAHLEGDLKTLKPWLGEAVYNKLAADIRTRKNDKIVFDANILNIDENQVIMRYLDDNGPVIVCIYMVQQINCIRKNGEIIEVRFTAYLYCQSSVMMMTVYIPCHLMTFVKSVTFAYYDCACLSLLFPLFQLFFNLLNHTD